MTPIDLRMQLLNAGYDPIPCNGKRPAMEDWASRDKTNPAEIGMWSSPGGYPYAQNTGVRCKFTPVLDIDIMNEEVSRAVEDLARESFEEHGTVIVRTGQAPKRAVPLRTDEPFKKMSRSFIPANGIYDPNKPPKIEILCDGQQCICFGIHPDTRQRYLWHGGEPGQIPREELPYVREADMVAFLDAAERLLAEQFGWQAMAKRPKANGGDGASHGGPADWAWLFDNIKCGRELHDSITALSAKLIAAHMGDGAIVNMIRGAMQMIPESDRDERWRERYAEIPRAVESARAKFAVRPPDKGSCGPFAGEVQLTTDDFVSFMPRHSYVFLPTRELWPGASVNSRVKPVRLIGPDGEPLLDDKGNERLVVASHWLDQNRSVEQMTWAPGEPMLIENRLIAEGGWIAREGCMLINLYRPPTLRRGNGGGAARWVEHVKRVYPDDADHIINWLAHRVQRPQEKINHALLLGGPQGIGKDTLIEPVKRAVGPWNVHEVSPRQVLGRFNGFLKSVILRVSEARDLGDYDRFAFYDHMKALTAAPPDVLRVDEKNMREYSVPNCCGIVITTNHKTDGIHLPADDRRHYAAWSDLTKDDFTEAYWKELWRWYDNGGDQEVAAYLASVDLSGFDPKAPPPKTVAFWAIVDAGRAPEDSELADALDALGNPDAVTVHKVQEAAKVTDFIDWLKDRRNSRQIPHRFEQCGYVKVRNSAAKDGQWVINGRRQAIYAKAILSERARVEAASLLVQIVG